MLEKGVEDLKDLKLKTPIYDALSGYSNSLHSSFHTPGHKSHVFDDSFFDIYKYDATELSVTDELYSPEGCISEAEDNVTKLYGSFHTFFSVGGASQCVKTSLSFFAGKKVIFDRNIHFSAAAAIAFYGIEAVFVYGECNDLTSIPEPPTVFDFKEALLKNSDAKAVFLTSPNYFGVSADCSAIRKLCDEFEVVFIDDNSHGAHYTFCQGVHNSAFDGHHAHVVIDSVHKTLPVMTGGALLHYNIPVSFSDVRRKMMAAGSTSPSFVLLASLDYGVSLCFDRGFEFYTQQCVAVENLRNELKNRGFVVTDGPNIDPLRLSVYFGENCDKVYRVLEQNNIYPEMQSNGFIVFIITPFNSRADMELLRCTLLAQSPVCVMGNFDSSFVVPERGLSVREAFFAEKESVSISNAVGRISAEMVSFHRPPCIPLCLPGEKISECLSSVLLKNGCDTIDVVVE